MAPVSGRKISRADSGAVMEMTRVASTVPASSRAISNVVGRTRWGVSDADASPVSVQPLQKMTAAMTTGAMAAELRMRRRRLSELAEFLINLHPPPQRHLSRPVLVVILHLRIPDHIGVVRVTAIEVQHLVHPVHIVLLAGLEDHVIVLAEVAVVFLIVQSELLKDRFGE